jgi:hypothetical protein
MFRKATIARSAELEEIIPGRETLGMMKCDVADLRVYREGYGYEFIEGGFVVGGAKIAVKMVVDTPETAETFYDTGTSGAEEGILITRSDGWKRRRHGHHASFQSSRAAFGDVLFAGKAQRVDAKRLIFSSMQRRSASSIWTGSCKLG